MKKKQSKQRQNKKQQSLVGSIKIAVTAKDISAARGRPIREGEIANTPIDVAIRRAFGKKQIVIGNHWVATFPSFQLYVIPREVSNVIRKYYDEQSTLKPFSFMLTPEDMHGDKALVEDPLDKEDEK